MLLVPRQLQRAGMTGDVPYYGGRLTPGHIYGLSHPAPQPPPPPPQAPPYKSSLTDKLESLQHLLETGVLSQSEYDTLRARVLA
jgi:hypothetical protein